MSARRNPQYFGLSHAEEVRMKTQLERVHQQFQKDFLGFKQARPDAPWGAGPQLLTEEQPFDQAHLFHPRLADSSWTPRAPAKSTDVTTAQRVTQELAGRWDGQECSNVHDGEKRAPEWRPMSQRPLFSGTEAGSRPPADRRQLKGSSARELKEETSPSTDRRIQKPAITSLAGTTKGVSIFSRPEPPSKLRSYRPAAPAQPPALKPLSVVQKKKSAPVAGRSASCQSRRIQEKKWQQVEEDSSSGTESDDNSSADSNGGGLQRTMRRRGMQTDMAGRVQKNPAMDSRRSQQDPAMDRNSQQDPTLDKRSQQDPALEGRRSQQDPTMGRRSQQDSAMDGRKSHKNPTMDRRRSQPKRQGSGSIATLPARSVPQLPTERPDTAGPGTPQTSDGHVQLSRPEERPSTLKVPVKAKARSVDEIIASLRSTGQPIALSASDLMIKELLASVLDQNYSMEREDELEKEGILQPLEMEASVEETPRTGSLPPALVPPQTASTKPTMSQNTELVVELRLDHAPECVPSPVLGPAPGWVPTTPLVSREDVSVEKVPAGGPVPLESGLGASPISADVMSQKEVQDALQLPVQVTISDIIHVKGAAYTITKPPPGKKSLPAPPPRPLLATWTPKNKESGHGTIHHFCTASPSHVLPSYLRLASRVHHTTDRMGHSVQLEGDSQSLLGKEVCYPDSPAPLETCEVSRIFHDGVPVSTLPEQQARSCVVHLPPHTSDSLEEWQRVAEYYVEGPRLELVGEKAAFHVETLKMFWTPAPPKFSAPLSVMEEVLFAKYESCLAEGVGEDEFLPELLEDEISEDERDQADDFLVRILSRRYTSLPDLMYPAPASSSDKMKAFRIKRCVSAPELPASKESMLKLPADFETSMKELKLLKEQLARPQGPSNTQHSSLHSAPPDEKQVQPPPRVKREESQEQVLSPPYMPLSASKASLADEARKAGMKYIVYPPKKKLKKSRKMLDPEKLKDVCDCLRQPPRIIERSVSLQRLDIHAGLRSAALASRRHQRNTSLPQALDFRKFSEERGGALADTGEREWVRGVWNAWFDEVFLPSSPPREEKESEVQVTIPSEQETLQKRPHGPTALVDSVIPVLLDNAAATVQDLEAEVSRLTELMEQQGENSVFHFCRRGALYRKLGKLSKSLEDLGKVTLMEPLLLDAYWQRHLIYRLQGRNAEALDDLNFILKYNKSHSDAYLSKAEICKSQGEVTLAILNYSQALKCQPSAADIYYSRAEMYERRGELILAMDDYAQSFFHNPQRTDAIMKHGLHHFENCNWSSAIVDFTALIKQNPHAAQARTYRGRAYTKLARYVEAIEDFSAAIHLDPLNWLAFYYRGCLLRKTHPQRALQDFSTSVLINDGFENLSSFLHRGIVYTELSLWSEAICDFESVIELDRTMALAHVNLGLVFFLHQDHYYKAIRQFSTAIQVAPTYPRAYLCRAQTYHKIHDLPKALKDITRAIHLQPDALQMYIIRGMYLFEMKRYELASFCIHYAAEMNQGTSPIQRALVQAFRQNYSKAIEFLTVALKTQPSASMFILLGKIQMKAKKLKDAVGSFEQALSLLDSPEKTLKLTPDSAEIFYLLGLCYVDQVHLLKALEAFASAVKVDPGYADAFYQRGLCRMRLKQAKCVQDFNRALAINPKLFQVYLSRAAFYGFKKRYTKAIMNCNEAIKIQPQSVRAYLYRGALKYYAKAYRLAIEDLTTAAQMDNTCSLAYYNRAVCYHETKSYEKAVTDYSIVLLLCPWKEMDIKVLINRGVLYLELRDYTNALQDFKEAMEKNPTDARIHQVLGFCHHRLGHFADAVWAFNQVLQLDPFSADAYVGRGNSYMEYGHKEGTKQAQKDFLTALHLNPKCLKARISLGYNLQTLGKLQRAWNQFTVALDIDAKCHLAYEGRAILNLQMGDTFAALQDISAALKLTTTAELLTNRGVIHQFLGKVSSAMKDYQAAVACDQHYALAYFNAANLYLHNRQLAQARDYYSKALNLDPSNESAALNRAITNVLLWNLPEALQDFEAVISRCPFSAAVYFNRANLYSALQQHELAEKDISKALALQKDDALMYKLRADIRVRLGFREEALLDYKLAVNLQESSKR